MSRTEAAQHTPGPWTVAYEGAGTKSAPAIVTAQEEGAPPNV